jgi:hypothetical protein
MRLIVKTRGESLEGNSATRKAQTVCMSSEQYKPNENEANSNTTRHVRPGFLLTTNTDAQIKFATALRKGET